MGACDKDHDAAAALKDLPESQREPMRHKCAGCAYELGFERGWKEGSEFVARKTGYGLYPCGTDQVCDEVHPLCAECDGNSERCADLLGLYEDSDEEQEPETWNK
jgi:hypothetical protein